MIKRLSLSLYPTFFVCFCLFVLFVCCWCCRFWSHIVNVRVWMYAYMLSISFLFHCQIPDYCSVCENWCSVCENWIKCKKKKDAQKKTPCITEITTETPCKTEITTDSMQDRNNYRNSMQHRNNYRNTIITFIYYKNLICMVKFGEEILAELKHVDFDVFD